MKYSQSSWLLILFPFLKWLHRVNPSNTKHDFIAGFTGAIVVLPQGIAFATIAGMPPEYGLYAGIVPAIIAALYGSSWHLVSGPTTAASLVLFSILSQYAEPYSDQYVVLALTLTFIVGLTQLIMGFAKLGALVNFISHSVIIGFTAGAAILIMSNQFKNFFGLPIPSGSEVYEIYEYVFLHIQNINLYILGVGLSTVFSGILIKRYIKAVPYMLGAMIIGSLTAYILNRVYGAELTGITTVGALPQTLPPLSSPDFSWEILRELIPLSLAVTLFALTEAVSIARAMAARSGQHLNSNQEFIGQGLSNIVGSFFSSYVATGSFNRTGVNYEAGAKTPLAAIFAGVLLLFAILVIAPLVAYLPHAAMAGILFLVGWGLIDFKHIKEILHSSQGESTVLGLTFFSTLLFDLEIAILIGVLTSLLLYLLRTSRPRILSRIPAPELPGRTFTTDASLQECPQVKIIRIDGSLFFGAISHVKDTLQNFYTKEPEQKHLMINAAGINFIDVAGAEFLAQEAKALKQRGGALYLYRVKEGMNEPLTKGHYIKDIGRDHVFRSKTETLHFIFSKLDYDICKQCKRRIFLECQTVPGPEDKPLVPMQEILDELNKTRVEKTNIDILPEKIIGAEHAEYDLTTEVKAVRQTEDKIILEVVIHTENNTKD